MIMKWSNLYHLVQAAPGAGRRQGEAVIGRGVDEPGEDLHDRGQGEGAVPEEMSETLAPALPSLPGLTGAGQAHL